MRRRYANREGWERLLARRFQVARVDRPGFHGYLTLLHIERVTAPLVVPLEGRQYRLADAGFRWLQHFPDGAHRTMTTLLDDNGAVVQWYFDVAAQIGVDERGVPWWRDLYLDVVVLPDGSSHLLDEDELEMGRAEGTITTEEYDLAGCEAARILEAVGEGRCPLLDQWEADLTTHFPSG